MRMWGLVILVAGCTGAPANLAPDLGLPYITPIRATANGSGKTVVDLIDPLDATPPPTRACVNKKDCQPLQNIHQIFGDSFEASFNIDAEGTLFTVFIDNGRPNTVTLPAPFQLASPSVVYPDIPDSIPITWKPSGTADRVEWRSMSLDCGVFGRSGSDGLAPQPSSDSGALSIPGSDLRTYAAGHACNLELIFARLREGDVMPGYSMQGVQARRLTLRLNTAADMSIAD